MSCTPFLQNAPSALLNLAAAASSSASNRWQHYTNIADLRRRHDKVEQMQGKYSMEDNEDDLSPQEEMNNNEATPNFLQKKIRKILFKLKLISDLSNVFHTSDESSTNSVNVDFDSSEYATNNDVQEITTVSSFKEREDVEEIPKQTFQKTIYSKSTNEAPIKLTLDINETSENEDQNTEINDANNEDQKNRFGQVGVFLAEVFGSLVALAYGASIQFNHFLQGTMQPPTAQE